MRARGEGAVLMLLFIRECYAPIATAVPEDYFLPNTQMEVKRRPTPNTTSDDW